MQETSCRTAFLPTASWTARLPPLRPGAFFEPDSSFTPGEAHPCPWPGVSQICSAAGSVALKRRRIPLAASLRPLGLISFAWAPARPALFPLRNSATKTPMSRAFFLGGRPTSIGIWEPEQLGRRRGCRPGWTPAPCRGCRGAGVRRSEGREWKKVAQSRSWRDRAEWKWSYKWEPLGPR